MDSFSHLPIIVTLMDLSSHLPNIILTLMSLLTRTILASTEETNQDSRIEYIHWYKWFLVVTKLKKNSSGDNQKVRMIIDKDNW